MKAVRARAVRLGVDVHHHLALLGELHRVREQVQQHLPQPGRVADDSRRHAFPDEAAELDPLVGGPRGDDVERSLGASAEIERLPLEVELARLDLRVVEDVVDHVEQGVAARPDDLRVLALLRCQLRSEQEAGHADHRVHRRPDLVAHRRQKRALRLRRRLRVLPGALELRDVARLLDRRRGERGEGLRHVRVLSCIEISLQAVERQHPHQAIADQQWHAHECLDASPAMGVLLEVLVLRGDVRHDDRLTRLDHLAGGIVRPPRVEAQSEQLVDVRKAVPADDHHLVAVELLDGGGSVGHHFAQLGQNQLEDIRQAERAAERLGRRTQRLGLLASGALGLEQPRVLDRQSSLGGKRGRELGQVLVVEVGLELVDAEDADHAIADDHGRTDPSANAAATVKLARKVRVLRDVGEDLPPLRPYGLNGEVGLVVQVESHSDKTPQIVEASPADDHQAVSLNHLDRAAVVRHDSLKLIEDRLEGVLEAQRLAEDLRDGEQRLGAQAGRFQLGDAVLRGGEPSAELGLGQLRQGELTWFRAAA